ncbi:hypothetical protein NQZ68_006216 [Dissostichus eleginoides]|nr:hypothetical protein NQZ68_006216 [Dissostichus eleginoides]
MGPPVFGDPNGVIRPGNTAWRVRQQQGGEGQIVHVSENKMDVIKQNLHITADCTMSELWRKHP